MANPIASAFVEIRPDFSNFQGQLQSGVNAAFKNLKVPPATQGQLAGQMFGPGFVSSSSANVTNALNNTKVPVNTQRTFAQQLFGPGFRNETGRALQGALVGLGGGQLAAQFAFFGAGGAAIAVAAGAMLEAVTAAARFEQSLNTLQAVAGLTEQELEIFADTAKDLGADLTLPAVTAQTAADAMAELAKAGLETQDVLDATRGVLQLATAAQTSAAVAAQVTASALNAFNLAGTEAVHVADLLAGASIASQANIHDMALALQQSATVAELTGVSVEQLVGLLTELARAGLRGSDAGTSIRTGLLRLIPTTKEAAEFMEVLGIEIDKTRTLGQQLPELLDQYNAAFERLTPTTRQAVLQQIAGTDAIRSLSIAIEGGSEGLEDATRASNKQGAAADLARAQTEGLAGAFQGLQSQVQTLGINVGTLLIPPLEFLVVTITNVIQPVNDLFEGLNELKEIAGDIVFTIKVNVPDVPDIPVPDIPGFDIPGVEFDAATFAAKKLSAAVGPLGPAFVAIGDGARSAQAGLDALGFGPAADEAAQLTARAEELNEELFAGGVGRSRAIEIQRELRQIEAQLDALSTQTKRTKFDLQDAFKGPLFPPGFLKPGESIIKQLEDQFKDVIDPNVLGRQLQSVLQKLQDPALTDAVRDVARERANSIIRELAALGPEGERVLRAAGARLIRGLADGITSEEARAINAARQTLLDVQREGAEQVQNAIRSARESLRSIGEDISSQVADLIDLGPIGQKISELEEMLDDLQERVSRRQLRFDLTQANIDLREAQESLIQIGVLTPAERRSQQEFLQPFQQKVGDAKAAIKEFDLTEAIEAQEALAEAAKKTAEEGIAVLVEQFDKGKISAGEFATQLRLQLKPQLDLIARENLGLTIESDFLVAFDNIVQQAKALAGFARTAATAPGTGVVVRPSETQAQVNRRIAESAASLQQIQKDAITKSDEEQEKANITNGLLRQILRAVGGTPGGGGRTGPVDKNTVRGGG